MRSIFTVLGSLRTNGPRRTPLSSVTKRLFLLSFTSEFIVIYPFYVIMFGQRGEVSAAGVGVLLAIWMVVSVLAEVPTGVIADKFSKKWALVLGRIMQFLTFAIWLAVPNFTGYLVGFVVWGIGEAFLSGAFQAYLYESLDDRHKQTFGKIYSRSNAFTMMAYMAGSGLAFILGPDYGLLLVVSMAVSLVSLGITLSLPNTRSQVEVELRPKILTTAFRAIRHNVTLRNMLIVAVILQGVIGMLAEYLPAYYHQVGVPTSFVPLVVSLGAGTAALLYWWMHRVEEQITKYRLLIVLGALVLFVLSFIGGVVVAVIGFFVFSRIVRMVAVHNESQIQHHAPNEARATVGSLYSFVGKVLSASIIGLVGVFAVQDRIVMPLRWAVVIGVAVFVLAGLYLAVSRKPLPRAKEAI